MDEFRWAALPVGVLDDLAAALRLPGEPAAALRARFGLEPDADFVRQVWTTLRDGWLRRDTQACHRVIGALVLARLGDPGAHARGDAAFLASCRNAPRLRRIVLAEFLRAGRGRVAHEADGGPHGEPGGGPRDELVDAFDLDVRLAWLSWADELTAGIESLGDGEALVLLLPVGSGEGTVLRLLLEDGVPAAEVLPDPLTAGQLHRLAALRWRRCSGDGQGCAAWHVRAPRGAAGPLAVLVMRTLQEVFAVPHPSFLLTAPTAAEIPVGELDPLAPVVPADPDHLRALMHAWLTVELGGPPAYEHGDAVVRRGRAVVHVRVHPDLPAVELVAPLLDEVAGTPVVLDRLNRLNDRLAFAKVVWREGAVLMAQRVDCLPFVPALASAALARMTEAAEELVARLPLEMLGTELVDLPRAGSWADVLGPEPPGAAEPAGPEPDNDGRADRAPSPDDPPEGPAPDDLERVLAELAAAVEAGSEDEPVGGPRQEHDDGAATQAALERVSERVHHRYDVQPEELADLCDRDRGLIIALIRRAESDAYDYIEAADSADLTDEDERELLEDEAGHWLRVARLLHRTLEVLTRPPRR